jgi:hypothetical protein
MTPKQIFLRMHENAPWKSRNVYNRDTLFKIKVMLNSALSVLIKYLKMGNKRQK